MQYPGELAVSAKCKRASGLSLALQDGDLEFRTFFFIASLRFAFIPDRLKANLFLTVEEIGFLRRNGLSSRGVSVHQGSFAREPRWIYLLSDGCGRVRARAGCSAPCEASSRDCTPRVRCSASVWNLFPNSREWCSVRGYTEHSVRSYTEPLPGNLFGEFL